MEIQTTNVSVEGAPQGAPDSQIEERSGLASLKRALLDILETLLISALLFWGIEKVSARILVDGVSMEPTLHNNQRVLVNRLAYKLGEPQRGDVIVFLYPHDQTQEYIKRIIGLPGDRVQVRDGEVFINDQRLIEPYIAAAPRYQSDWTVPENTLFVLGDNRNNSHDSHNWGPVPMDLVVGKAMFIYWPPENWSLISHLEIASILP